MPEQSKYLTEHLFNPARVSQGIDETRQTVEELRTNMGNKEAEERLNNALDRLIAAVEADIFGPSPRLTDEENDQYMALKRKKLVERHSRNHKWFDRIKLADEEESLYERLEAKADGRDLHFEP